jgi:hypothetical protein
MIYAGLSCAARDFLGGVPEQLPETKEQFCRPIQTRSDFGGLSLGNIPLCSRVEQLQHRKTVSLSSTSSEHAQSKAPPFGRGLVYLKLTCQSLR